MSDAPQTQPSSPLIDVSDLLAQFQAAGADAGFNVAEFGRVDSYPLLALTKRSPGLKPRIYLSAGIHGDEPAPPQALLAMLRAGVFDDRATWFICPVLNPIGLSRGTREDAQQRDLNRDYKDRQSPEVQAHTAWLESQPLFDLTVCLHEDWESQGFYLYELNPTARTSLASDIIAAVKAVMPIESANVIDEREVDEPGIIRPVSDPLLRESWPEAIYLRRFHTTLCYTVETPSALPLEQRIAALSVAAETALKHPSHG